jgi:hypothetical protein
MTIPGVGPVVALTYRVTVDVPGPLQELQGSWSSVWTDTLQVSIRPDNVTVEYHWLEG